MWHLRESTVFPLPYLVCALLLAHRYALHWGHWGGDTGHSRGGSPWACPELYSRDTAITCHRFRNECHPRSKSCEWLPVKKADRKESILQSRLQLSSPSLPLCDWGAVPDTLAVLIVWQELWAGSPVPSSITTILRVGEPRRGVQARLSPNPVLRALYIFLQQLNHRWWFIKLEIHQPLLMFHTVTK